MKRPKDSAFNGGNAPSAIRSTLGDRFKVPVSACKVDDKERLARYRAKWMEWISWYGDYGSKDPQPNGIESQIQRMLFDDLTYRTIASVRGSVDAEIAISARSSTLAYLLDQGYVVSQVLSIQKLLDPGRQVISIRRLLKDVEKHRDLITREVYVSGTGLPYDYDSWRTEVSESDPMVQMWSFDAPILVNYQVSKTLHESFDQLTGKAPDQRTRGDLIPGSIFKRLESWIGGVNAEEIKFIRDNFIAHAAPAMSLGSAKFSGVKFSQIEELQRGIVRVERALTDEILSIRVGRDVVPMPPLGIFHGLGLPYSPPETEMSMYQRWKELKTERNAWRSGILEDLTVKSLRSKGAGFEHEGSGEISIVAAGSETAAK